MHPFIFSGLGKIKREKKHSEIIKEDVTGGRVQEGQRTLGRKDHSGYEDEKNLT